MVDQTAVGRTTQLLILEAELAVVHLTLKLATAVLELLF
jgi:hypothetical protein